MILVMLRDANSDETRFGRSFWKRINFSASNGIQNSIVIDNCMNFHENLANTSSHWALLSKHRVSNLPAIPVLKIIPRIMNPEREAESTTQSGAQWSLLILFALTSDKLHRYTLQIQCCPYWGNHLLAPSSLLIICIRCMRGRSRFPLSRRVIMKSTFVHRIAHDLWRKPPRYYRPSRSLATSKLLQLG